MILADNSFYAIYFPPEGILEQQEDKEIPYLDINAARIAVASRFDVVKLILKFCSQQVLIFSLCVDLFRLPLTKVFGI